MGTRAIRGATLIDGTGRDPIPNAIVVIEGDRIVSVGGNGAHVPADAEVIDGTGLTLLPGLIDCHIHAMTEGINIVRTLQTPPSLGLFEAIPRLQRTIHAGFTTVRDAGGSPLGVKMAVDRGIIPGPRMQISITVLSQTGGHGDHHTHSCIDMPFFPALPDVPHGVVDGVDEMRQRVREILRAGADWIKLCTTGGVLSATDLPSATQFNVDEIATAVYEARADGGKECMAHAQGTQGIKNAIVGGVKSIEHGIWLDDEAIAMMKERDVYLVPTLVAPVQVLRQGERNPASMPPWAVEKARQVVHDHQDSFRRAYRAGVKIAMGTDSGVGPHGENAEELTLMAQNGMSPMETIVATTARAAELLRLQDRIGTVEAGKLADLVLVDGNPLDDVSVLQNTERILLVLKGGATQKDLLAVRATSRVPA